mmetsp:Transcript_22732/g.49449  ORF Transcript_22732/g.49449 Transcript_22732/m.49449 type:complete len:243 (-) Transcript_22732:1333-2061(-)
MSTTSPPENALDECAQDQRGDLLYRLAKQDAWDLQRRCHDLETTIQNLGEEKRLLERSILVKDMEIEKYEKHTASVQKENKKMHSWVSEIELKYELETRGFHSRESDLVADLRKSQMLERESQGKTTRLVHEVSSLQQQLDRAHADLDIIRNRLVQAKTEQEDTVLEIARVKLENELANKTIEEKQQQILREREQRKHTETRLQQEEEKTRDLKIQLSELIKTNVQLRRRLSQAVATVENQT